MIKLAEDETLEWPDLEYKKAWAERDKRLAVLSFDVHDDLCTILRKGKADRLQSVSDIVGFTEDAANPAGLTLQFALPDDPKKQKKFVEFERFEVWNRFDRQIIAELINHATENSGSIKDLDDSFPKQTLHHSVLQIKQKTSFDTKYCVLVKWKLYIYDDWYSKHTVCSVCLMGVDIEKDPKDKKKLTLNVSPVPIFLRCNDEEERDFWFEMLYSSASMAMPGEEQLVEETGMDWGLFDELIEQIRADDAELDELDFSDPDWHLNEGQAFYLAEALMTPNMAVKKLDLSCNLQLGESKGAISELLMDNLNCVTDLAMMGCDLRDDGLELFCDQLSVNTTCKSLDISYNDISDTGMQILAECLAKNQTLKDLDLTGNKMTQAGFETLARGLTGAALTRLVLASMEPGDEGLASIVEALKQNNTLEELDLEGVTVTDEARTQLTEMLTVNHKVTITGCSPPIERPIPEEPEAEPEPDAEPEPEPEPPKKKKKKRPPPPAMKFDEQGNIITNFADVNHLDDGKLDGPGQGDGFMGMLSMWRDTEVLVERQDEMAKVDPRKREELRARFDNQDSKKWHPSHSHGTAASNDTAAAADDDDDDDPSEAVPPTAKPKAGGRSFGVPIAQLEMVSTDEGMGVPKVLSVLRLALGDASAPQILLKQPDPSAKASAREKLDACDYSGCSDLDPYVAAELFLEFFGEYPGGVLADLSDSARQNMDTDEGALAALEGLPDALQEAMTFLIDTTSFVVANKDNGVDLDEAAQRVAEFVAPVPSADDGQLLIYLLLCFWAENA